MTIGEHLKNKTILVTGGTGSIGGHLVKRILKYHPSRIIIFSRDEAKQHNMRLKYSGVKELEFRIGDIRRYEDVLEVVQEGPDIIFNAAAMKHVPVCEYHPYDAVLTNVQGAENIVKACRAIGCVDTVVGMSTDKACNPISVMGMTKAIQERIFIHGNLRCPDTKFVCVRYGNILTSRGSVLQTFLAQIEKGGPLTITDKDMTRFFISLDIAYETAFAAVEFGLPGEIFVPQASSLSLGMLADALMAKVGKKVEVEYIGLRPGEKLHEELLNPEEANRAYVKDIWFVIHPELKELQQDHPPLLGSSVFCSKHAVAGPGRARQVIEDALQHS